ncbi:ABC transporter permease [Rhodovibrionaceae bacterium A322]
MDKVLLLAGKEVKDGLRNRWVAAAILLLSGLSLLLALVGTAPVGSVQASQLEVTLVSLSSLTVYLMPLLALMLSYDAIVGEFERGSMLLLLSYPIARWQVLLGKFLGHLAILALALTVGYGATALLIAVTDGADLAGLLAFVQMIGTSLLLGAAFLALGYLLSCWVKERATAAGAAIGLWLALVVLYDLGLLALLLAQDGQLLSESLFSLLLTLNPTDAYRLLNLSGGEGGGLMAGLNSQLGGLDLLIQMLVLAVWTILPLSLALRLFHRREL